MKSPSPTEFYQEIMTCTGTELSTLLPTGIQQEVGQFNVFDLSDLLPTIREKPGQAFPCRAFYKISLLTSSSRVYYANKTIDIQPNTLIFSTPKVPHYWQPQSSKQTGQFCIFSAEFLQPTKSGVVLDELPIFKASDYLVVPLAEPEISRTRGIFEHMREEMASNYAFKYDLLRTYVLELIHFGQKFQPATALHPSHSAAARMTSLFVELLEQQFPLENSQQQVRLRTAKEYADHLAVHVNHLNKVLKETTGLTTTELISERITQEAKTLLNQTHWTIAEIADSLGFADIAHFSKFFKRQTSLAPIIFREQGNDLNLTKRGLVQTNTALSY